MSEGLFFDIAGTRLTNTTTPEEDRSLASLWELTDLSV